MTTDVPRSKPWRDPSLPDGDCVQATEAQRQALVEAEFGAYPTASFTDVPLDRNVSRISVQSGTQPVLPSSGVEGYDEKGRSGTGMGGGETLEYHAEKDEPEAQRHHDENQVIEEASKMEYIEPGWKGWLNCAGSVMVNMICYGMTQSWGVFQQEYLSGKLSDTSGMAVSWIGSIQFALCPMLGCISGPLLDCGYLKHLILFGGLLYSFCFMMASLSREYWQVLLSHGFGVGIGKGLIFSPSVATLSHHFARSRYRTLAFGFQASGSAISGIYLPIMLNYLIPAVGVDWSLRILGFLVLAFCAFAFFALSTTVPPRKKVAVLSPEVFRNKAYTVYVAGACLASMAIYAPQTFGVTYATSKGVPVSLANYAPAIANGVSLFGRIIPLFFAQRIGPINVLAAFGCASGFMMYFWTLTNSAGAILAYDAIYGIASGGYGASLNPGAASFAPHTNQAGLYLGMCFFVSGWFWLAGTPITAQLKDTNDTYLEASMFCATVVLVGGIWIGVSRVMRSKQVGTKWV